MTTPPANLTNDPDARALLVQQTMEAVVGVFDSDPGFLKLFANRWRNLANHRLVETGYVWGEGRLDVYYPNLRRVEKTLLFNGGPSDVETRSDLVGFFPETAAAIEALPPVITD